MGAKGFKWFVLGQHLPPADPGSRWDRQAGFDNVRFTFRYFLSGLSRQLPDKGVSVEHPISRRNLAFEPG
jgi:hypothetical protein